MDFSVLIILMSPFLVLGISGSCFHFCCIFQAISVDPDQMPRFAASELDLHCLYNAPKRVSRPEVIKLFFSRSTQLSMKLFLLKNVKMPTIVGILTFMGRKNFIPKSEKNSILCLSEPKKSRFFIYIFYTYEHLKFHAQLSRA